MTIYRLIYDSLSLCGQYIPNYYPLPDQCSWNKPCLDCIYCAL